MDYSTPGFPIHHQLPELGTHVHRVSDAIQPSHPLLSPFPPAFNLSQHQVFFKHPSLFQRVSSSHQVDGPRDYHIKWSKSEREINIWYHLYMEPKIWLKWSYFQNGNRFTDLENNLWLPEGKEREEGYIRILDNIYTLLYIKWVKSKHGLCIAQEYLLVKDIFSKRFF